MQPWAAQLRHNNQTLGWRLPFARRRAGAAGGLYQADGVALRAQAAAITLQQALAAGGALAKTGWTLAPALAHYRLTARCAAVFSAQITRQTAGLCGDRLDYAPPSEDKPARCLSSSGQFARAAGHHRLSAARHCQTALAEGAGA